MEQKQVKRKKNFVRARFFSMILSIFILGVIGFFFWRATQLQIPNLHGWESTEVLAFANKHNIEIEFEFVYSIEMAPTLVMRQSVPPGTAITEGMQLAIEISKGVEVR